MKREQDHGRPLLCTNIYNYIYYITLNVALTSPIPVSPYGGHYSDSEITGKITLIQFALTLTFISIRSYI